MTFIIPCWHLTLGITLKFNACQIGQVHLIKLSKYCPALPEAWAPAFAGAHAEPLYNDNIEIRRVVTVYTIAACSHCWMANEIIILR